MTERRTPRYTLEMSWQALFKDLGISPQDLLRHAHLPLDLMTRKMPTITGDEYFRLWDGLAHLLRDEPTFPLRIAQAISIESFSPPLFACLSSTDLNMALNRIAKYKPLVGPLRLNVTQSRAQTTFSVRGLPGMRPLPESLIAFELAFWVQVARAATRDRIRPKAVHLTITLPEIAQYEAYFGVPVQHDQFDGLTFSAEDAQKPFLTANDAMWAIFEPELNMRMKDLDQQSDFRMRVRACLMEIMASGHYSMADVASRLAVSTRTLQRRLSEENTTFQKEIDSLREELARTYLAKSDYSSGQIAFLLGYEDPNSFFRAFRAWTGQTPEGVRAQAQ